MKRLGILAALLAALALPSLALAADGPPPGKYTAKIATPAPLKGTWTLSFAKNGTYTVVQNGKIAVRGHDLSIAPQMQFYKETGRLACKSLGFYNFKRAGKKLTFEKLHDTCAARSLVLGHAFTFAG